jgi:hypothetical protein
LNESVVQGLSGKVMLHNTTVPVSRKEGIQTNRTNLTLSVLGVETETNLVENEGCSQHQ